MGVGTMGRCTVRLGHRSKQNGIKENEGERKERRREVGGGRRGTEGS